MPFACSPSRLARRHGRRGPKGPRPSFQVFLATPGSRDAGKCPPLAGVARTLSCCRTGCATPAAARWAKASVAWLRPGASLRPGCTMSMATGARRSDGTLRVRPHGHPLYGADLRTQRRPFACACMCRDVPASGLRSSVSSGDRCPGASAEITNGAGFPARYGPAVKLRWRRKPRDRSVLARLAAGRSHWIEQGLRPQGSSAMRAAGKPPAVT